MSDCVVDHVVATIIEDLMLCCSRQYFNDRGADSSYASRFPHVREYTRLSGPSQSITIAVTQVIDSDVRLCPYIYTRTYTCMYASIYDHFLVLEIPPDVHRCGPREAAQCPIQSLLQWCRIKSLPYSQDVPFEKSQWELDPGAWFRAIDPTGCPLKGQQGTHIRW